MGMMGGNMMGLGMDMGLSNLMGGGGPMGPLGMGGGGAFGFLSGGNTPQDRGYGLAGPAPFVGYQTSPGLQPGNGSGYQGLDMSGPGAAESYYGRNQHQLQGPTQSQMYNEYAQPQLAKQGAGEQFQQQAQAQYGGGRQPQVTNQSRQEYQAARQARPNLSANAGLDPYYDNAQRKQSEDIDKSYAARGMYGSSAALDQQSEASTNLRAQQANREADYALQRSGEDRAWHGLTGNLAGQSDQRSDANSQNQLSWMQGLGGLANQAQNQQQQRMSLGGNLAGNADTSRINQFGAGMGAASGAQQMQMDRANQLFGQNMGFGSALSGLAGDVYGNMMGQDQALMDGSMGMSLGLGAEALGQDYRGQQRIKDDMSWASDMASGFMPMMGMF